MGVFSELMRIENHEQWNSNKKQQAENFQSSNWAEQILSKPQSESSEVLMFRLSQAMFFFSSVNWGVVFLSEYF